MPWVRIEDSMTVHSKVLPLSDGAFRAHVEAICHCARELTDGRISERVAKAMRWSRRVSELVEAGLWEVVDGGWYIHDYLEYNPSREQVEAGRAEKHQARVRAGRIGGVRSGESRRSKAEAEPKQTRSTDEANRKQNEANRKQNEAPSRPVPSRPVDPIPITRGLSLTAEQRTIADALFEQVHRLIYGGSGYPETGWCEDLIRDGATMSDVDHAIQSTVGRGIRAKAYVRAILEGRVKERKQGRDPDAVSAGPSSLESGAYAGKGRARSVAPTGDGAHFSNTPPEA